MTGYWHNITIWVKPPLCRGVAVPVLVMHFPKLPQEDGRYEVTEIDKVELSARAPKPEWGKLDSELKWLEQYAMPNLWQQVAWRVWEKEDG